MAKFVTYEEYARMFKDVDMVDDAVDPCAYCVYEYDEPECDPAKCRGGLFISEEKDQFPYPYCKDTCVPYSRMGYCTGCRKFEEWEEKSIEQEENVSEIQSEPLKYNDGKPFVELVLGDFAAALLEVAKVGTMGAKKYSPHGWKENDTPLEDKIVQIDDAKGRHRLAYQMGEECCPESELLHRAHEAWNALAALTLIVEDKNDTAKGPRD